MPSSYPLPLVPLTHSFHPLSIKRLGRAIGQEGTNLHGLLPRPVFGDPCTSATCPGRASAKDVKKYEMVSWLHAYAYLIYAMQYNASFEQSPIRNIQ